VGVGYRKGGAFATVDLRHRSEVREVVKAWKPRAIIFAAGITNTRKCEKDPSAAYAINAVAANFAATVSPRSKFIYLSTDYVFDGIFGGYREDSVPSPSTIYGRSKLEGERATLTESERNVVVRLSGLFDNTGTKTWKFAETPSNPEARDDTRFSSPVHIEDVIEALRTILVADLRGIVHAGGPHRISRYEFAQIMNLHGGHGHYIEAAQLTAKGTGPRDSSLRSERLSALGWRPRPVHEHSRPNMQVRHRHMPPCLLIDCVGVLLARRNWLISNAATRQADIRCASPVPEIDGFELCGSGSVARSSTAQAVSERYVPNPWVWSRLPRWRGLAHLVLANNGPSETFRTWDQRYGLSKFFEFLLNSQEIGYRKPSPIFFDAATRLSGCPLGRTIVLDDSEEVVRGARVAGAQSMKFIEHRAWPVSTYIPSPIGNSDAALDRLEGFHS
jgi:dTDP-4-dehydrorhamnose reductase